ncbi:MAG: tautomerase family protein [Rhodospirillales bacterium]|nr:tautomerase family protein [Rhodospirillales bacterium]
MPHVIVKMYPGRSAAQKAQLAYAVTEALMQSLGCKEGAVSVGVEDVAQEDWMAAVYTPDITEKAETIVKKPGYGPAAG